MNKARKRIWKQTFGGPKAMVVFPFDLSRPDHLQELLDPQFREVTKEPNQEPSCCVAKISDNCQFVFKSGAGVKVLKDGACAVSACIVPEN